MTNVLIFGSQTDIGRELVKKLKDSYFINIVYIHIQTETVEDFGADWYEPFARIKESTRNRLLTALKYEIRDAMNVFSLEMDYVINCHYQPLDGFNDAIINSTCNVIDSTLLATVCRENGFKGSFINLSSFAIYGTAPDGIKLKRDEAAFSIEVPRTDEDEDYQEKFGFDSTYGIAEKLEFAPNKRSSYGLTMALREKNIADLASDKYHVLTLRLPYMIQNSIREEYKPYMDRINILLDKLKNGETLISTYDNTDKCVYDFLTPLYVSNFICDLIQNQDIVIGTYNIGSRFDNEFSELQLLKKLKEMEFENIEHIKEFKDRESPLAFYMADCRNLENTLVDHATNLELADGLAGLIGYKLAEPNMMSNNTVNETD